MSYTVAVSAGIMGAAQQEEKMQYSGLYRKANYALTKGVNFVQIDLESISEFQEAHLEENMKKVRELGIKYGLHSETPAFGAREFPHLDSAIDVEYRRGHERLNIIIDGAGKIGTIYMLMHSSESTPFIFLTKEFQPSELVDIWGRPFDQFIDEIGKTEGTELDPEGNPRPKNWILDWIWDEKQKYIWKEFIGQDPHQSIVLSKKERLLSLKQQYRENTVGAKFRETKMGQLTPEEEKGIEDITKVIKASTEHELEIQLKEHFMREFKERIRSRMLHYGPERIAYYIIAKWMEKENDTLWNNIIDITVKYYAKRDKMEEEEWIHSHEIKKVNGKWSIEDEHFRNYYQLWVPAVSAKYMWGHMMPETSPTETPYKHMDPKQLLMKNKLFYVLETPMASPGMEDLLRFPQPAQMYYLIKEINESAGQEIMGIAVDIEHMLMDGLNIEAAFDILPEDGGKLIRVVHTGWPSPLGPAHLPIPIGSDQQRYLYETYYKLRHKGMGLHEECYIVFERGGGQDPIQQSVLAIRMIVEELEKNTSPEHLPLKFYGVSPEGFLSEQRQRAMVFEHRYDPLRGLVIASEEEHTFLGKSALEKPGMSPEKWKKEELR
ncbi:hypothetical protein EPN87_03735 [archaeon]|nr:MAG: hypothetical protein EPN87_03735 [archaeon]